jgi:Holliday junction resolvase
MSGRASRRKGQRTERAIVRLLQGAGFAATKTSRTGYSGPDLSIPLLDRDLRCEVKCRSNGFRELYAWLDSADLLIVKADRLPPLCVLPLKLASEIAALVRESFIGGNNEKDHDN